MSVGKRVCCGVLSVLAVLAVPLPQKLAVGGVKTVEYTQAVRENHRLTAACDGELCCEERGELYLTSPVYVDELLVSVGDTVAAGDVLLTVDGTMTEAVNRNNTVQREEVETAEALALLGGVSREELEQWMKQYGTTENTAEKKTQDTAQILHRVESPFAGRILQLNAGENRMCGQDGPVAVIENPDSIYAKLYIGERYADELQVGAPVSLNCDVLGDGVILNGIIRKILPEVQKRLNGSSVERVICFEAVLEKGEKLVSGSSVTGKVYLGEEYSCITLPYECIRQDETGEYIFVIREGRAEKVYIMVEREFSHAVQVSGSVREGERVICCPDEITEGMAVRGTQKEETAAEE